MDNRIDEYVDEILEKSVNDTQSASSYWNSFYNNPNESLDNPSDFARFSLGYMKAGAKLIDIGCGNGRDSLFFDKAGLKVTAIDFSEIAINAINKSKSNVFAICGNFITAKLLFCLDYNYCYARWSIHSIDSLQQNYLLTNIFKSLHQEGKIFIEVRTINDHIYGQGQLLGKDEYFFDGHYRRFIRPEEFSDQLQSIGYKLIYIEESDNFSVIGNDRPMLLRVVACK
jgi:2-polyprenyl-3-methyl-5-hydroxy-6-metoxy-1,4-benzoquinol methylase